MLRHLLGTWLIIPVEQGVENEGTLYPVAFVDELRDQESPENDTYVYLWYFNIGHTVKRL